MVKERGRVQDGEESLYLGFYASPSVLRTTEGVRRGGALSVIHQEEEDTSVPAAY